jgi:hypothetical protein
MITPKALGSGAADENLGDDVKIHRYVKRWLQWADASN